MSTDPVTASTGLTPLDRAKEPSWVRHGSAAVQKDYAGALAFEQTLVEQLAKTMLATSGLGGQGEGEEGSEDDAAPADAAGGLLGSLLPQALAGGVSANGGFGIAAQLTRGLAGSSEASAPVAGAVAAPAGGAGAPAAASAPAADASTDTGAGARTGGTAA